MTDSDSAVDSRNAVAAPIRVIDSCMRAAGAACEGDTMTEARSRDGRGGEALAAAALELEGYTIVGRNVRVADVEVDVLARLDRLLVVVEVKTRRRPLVPAVEGLRPPQIRRLRRAAGVLLEAHPEIESVRLDVIGIDCHDGTVSLRHLRGVG